MMHTRSCCDLSKEGYTTSASQKNNNQIYPIFGNLLEAKASTLNLKMAKSFEQLSTVYGTLPRPGNNPIHAANERSRIALQAIGAVTSLFQLNKEENIIDEELRYLQAVERGDLKEVEQILIYQQREEKKQKIKRTGEVSRTEDGPQKGSDRLEVKQIFLDLPNHQDYNNVHNEKETQETADTTLDLKGLSPKKKTKSGRYSVWSISGSSRCPIPVGLVKKNISGKVLDGHLNEENLDSKANCKPKEPFNKNCRDQWGRSALFIALIHRNLDMMKLLLRYKVESEECLYHAVDFGYYAVVDIFMQNEKNTKQMIGGEQSYYSPGLTPYQLAAHKNDYVMLRMLHDHGFRITTESKQRAFSKRPDPAYLNRQNDSVLNRAWDASNHQLLYYRAISSPAYLILSFDEGLETNTGNWDFLDNIFRLYGELKKKMDDEPAVQFLYMPLADQVEEFACDLLNEVRSADDLANLLRFNPPDQTQITQHHFLAPVEQAITVRMKKFVAHQNCQVAISSLRLGTLFYSEHGWRTLINRTLLALVFPILCLAFSFAPDSKLGKLLCNPIVSMSCHIMSEIVFLLLLIIRLILLTHFYPCDCLGTQIYPIDYLIWLWVAARIVKLVQKFFQQPLICLLRNVWVLNDLTTSFLFLIVIIVKIYDVAKFESLSPFQCPATNRNSVNTTIPFNQEEFERQCTRSLWTPDEVWPITISEAALAVIYFLIHIRVMEILYTHRTFGPLQLSLDKMFIDTIRFLTIFLFTFIGFSFAMTQLYWAWGKNGSFNNTTGVLPICSDDTEREEACSPVYSFPLESILEQYWTLYGYGFRREPPQATRIPVTNQTEITETAGQIVSMIFHGWAVVVMLNVLVAMLSHSFDRVRNNAELEWKFHRSKTWMKYIQKGVSRPPPMNLFPSVKEIRTFWNFLKIRLWSCKGGKSISPKRRLAQRDSQDRTQRENLRYRKALVNITQRYTRRYLLPDFRHNDFDQPTYPSVNPCTLSLSDTEVTTC